MEMVRQRLTQDYQLVPLSHINPSNYRRQSLNRTVSGVGIESDGTTNVTRQFLSMGHRLQVLSYDPSADVIEVTLYDAKTTREASGANSFIYHYHCFCQETQRYSKVVQTFEKYMDAYNWNKVDRIICGDEQRELREGMRFKRLMFVVIPDRFQNHIEEKEYVAKFQRLLEYLNKLRDRGDESTDQLEVKIITSAERQRDPSIPVESTVGVERGMQRFYVRLRKGALDKLEWMEIVVDATFDTLWSYRIMFHWLVAGSAKVETQVQVRNENVKKRYPTLSFLPHVLFHAASATQVYSVRFDSGSYPSDLRFKELVLGTFQGTRYHCDSRQATCIPLGQGTCGLGLFARRSILYGCAHGSDGMLG